MNGLYALKPWYARRLGRLRRALVTRNVAPGTVTAAGVAAGTAAGVALATIRPGPVAAVVVGALLAARLACANLDGAVNFSDLVKLAQNYNTTVSATTDSWWFRGDFTGDGVTNFSDLVKLAQNYNRALSTDPIPGAPAEFENDLNSAFASVPEPSITVFVVVATCALALRRRHGAGGSVCEELIPFEPFRHENPLDLPIAAHYDNFRSIG